MLYRQVTFSEGVPVYSSPAFSRDGGAIYFGSDDTHLYAVASADGAALWAVATGAEVQSTPTVGPDGAVVFGSWDSTITSVEPNGRVRWSATTGGKVVHAERTRSPIAFLRERAPASRAPQPRGWR